MKSKFKNILWILGLLLIGGITYVSVMVFRPDLAAGPNDRNTLKSPPLTTSISPQPIESQQPTYELRNTPSPTPDMFTIPEGTSEPSPIPIIISNEIDLAPELSENDKIKIFVQHLDGTITLFWYGPAPEGIACGQPNLPQEVLAALPLNVGDRIYGWSSWPWRMVDPPRWEPSETPWQPSVTPWIGGTSYPVPLEPSQTPLVRDNPYPYPAP